MANPSWAEKGTGLGRGVFPLRELAVVKVPGLGISLKKSWMPVSVTFFRGPRLTSKENFSLPPSGLRSGSRVRLDRSQV